MDNNANSVGNSGAGGEALVAAFVAEDPETGHDGALDDYVEHPEGEEGERIQEHGRGGEGLRREEREEGGRRLAKERSQRIGGSTKVKKRGRVCDGGETGRLDQRTESGSVKANNVGNVQGCLESNLLVVERDDEHDGDHDDVIGEVTKRLVPRTLEAVCGDRLADIIQGEGRRSRVLAGSKLGSGEECSITSKDLGTSRGSRCCRNAAAARKLTAPGLRHIYRDQWKVR